MTSPIEINGISIRDYASSHKFCKFTQTECEMEPKSSQLILDLSNFSNISKIVLFLKRKSGNGTIQIKYGSKSFNFSVVRKFAQELSITGDGNLVEFSRDKNSLGVIAIEKLEVYSNTERRDIMPNWKSIIKRCGQYSHLRLIGGDLFASPGAVIEDKGRISHIETDPPQMFVRESQKINFVGSCKITRIDLKTAPVPSASYLPNREAPSPALQAPSISANVSTQRIAPHNPPVITDKAVDSFSSNIIFNSIQQKSFDKYLHIQSKKAKAVTGNKKTYLSLENEGSATFTINNLEGDKEYLCIITAKALGGNGKIEVNLAHQEGDMLNSSEVVFPSGASFFHKYVSLRSLPTKFGKMHRINLSKTTRGEVLIERILIIEGADIPSAKSMVDSGHINNYISRNKIATVNAPEIYVKSQDPYYRNNKIFARYETFVSSDRYEVVGNVLPLTESGIFWANKLSSVSSVKVLNNQLSNSLAVIKLGDLPSSESVWVEYFESSDNLSGLNGLDGKRIFTPSLMNKQVISQYCPSSEISCVTKPLPWTSPTYMSVFKDSDYLVYFHRDEASTQRILKFWNESRCKLVLIGARGSFATNIIPVNEYLPYDIILGILLKSRGVLDLTKINDRASGMIDLSLDLGLPVASTSWAYLTTSYFVPSLNDSFLEEAYEKIIGSSKKEPMIDKIKSDFMTKCGLLFK